MSENTPAPQRRSAARTIARNTLFGLGAQFALRIVSFIFQILVINTLGDSAFGQYSIVLAWAGLFGVIGDLGINQYLGREIARNPRRADDLFWDTVSLRFLLAILASSVTVIGAVLRGYDTSIVIGILIYTSSYFVQALLAPLGSIISGNERVDVMSTMAVITQILFMIFAGLFLFAGLDFTWVVIASVINLPVVLAVQWWFIRRNRLGPPRFKVNVGMWWSVIKAGLPFGFIQISLSFAFRVDTILLSGQVSDSQVGWYNAAYNLTLTLLTLTRTFNDAILPTLAREHVNNPDSVRPWYYHSVKVILFIGLPVAVGGMLTSDQIVSILYEPSFVGAAVVLAILVWDIPVVMYHSFCGNMTTSIKREGGAARIYGTLGVVNVLLNLILIPRFGILGAAFSTVLTDFAGAAQFYLLFRHEFGPGLGFTRLIRLVGAVVIMGGLIVMLRSTGLLAFAEPIWLQFMLIAGAAAVIYAIVVWFSGAFSPQERARLTGFVIRRLRPRTA